MLAATVLAVALPARPALAYWDEVHYQLAYFLARITGYTPEQAYRIAAAASSADWDPATEPTQKEDPTEANQLPRWRYHSFRKAWGATGPVIGQLGTDEIAALDAQVIGQRAQLFDEALVALNPGVWLHFYQDELPHYGFASEWGHWPLNEAAVKQAEALDLKIGGSVDWFSFHAEDVSNAITAGWTRDLLEYMKRIAPLQAAARGRVPATDTYSNVLDRLREDNPAPAPLTKDELIPYKWYYVAMRAGFPISAGSPALERKFSEHAKGPDNIKVNNVIEAAMRARAMVESPEGVTGLPPYEPQRRRFKFNTAGALVPTQTVGVNEYVLVGTLAVVVPAELGGADGKSVDVAVKLPPTMNDEQEVELTRKYGVSPGGTVEFEKVPVGDLTVEAWRGTTLLARREKARLMSQRGEVKLAGRAYLLRPGSAPKVKWHPFRQWTAVPGSPVFEPESGWGPIETEGSEEWLRSMPRQGRAVFKYTDQLGSSAEITLTESSLVAKLADKRGDKIIHTVYEIDLGSRPPDAIYPGDKFPLGISGKVTRDAEDTSGQGSGMYISLLDFVGGASRGTSNFVLGYTTEGYKASGALQHELEGGPIYDSQGWILYGFHPGNLIDLSLFYMYDPSPLPPQDGGTGPGTGGPGGGGSQAPSPDAGAGSAAPAVPPTSAAPAREFRSEAPIPPRPPALVPADRAPNAGAVRPANPDCAAAFPPELVARASALGCPVRPSEEVRSAAGTSATLVRFQGRAVVLHRTGKLAGRAFELDGDALDLYDQLGGPASWLGLPVADPIRTASGERIEFEGGYVVTGQVPGGAQAFRPGAAAGR